MTCQTLGFDNEDIDRLYGSELSFIIEKTSNRISAGDVDDFSGGDGNTWCQYVQEYCSSGKNGK